MCRPIIRTISQLEMMGKDAAIPENHNAPVLLASTDPESPLKLPAACLRAIDVSELTWDYGSPTCITFIYYCNPLSIACSSARNLDDSKGMQQIELMVPVDETLKIF